MAGDSVPLLLPDSGRPGFSRSGLWLRAGALCFLLAAYGGSWFLTRADLPATTLCPLRRFSGVPCVSCGFTRGFVAISHGELSRAVELNVLTPAVYLLGLALAPLVLYELFSGRDLVDRFLRRHRRAVYATVVAAVLVRYGAFLW